jgi:hypothetical protein
MTPLFVAYNKCFWPAKINRLRVNGWKRIFQVNVEVFICDRVNFKPQLEMIKKSVHIDEGNNPEGIVNNNKHTCFEC